MQIEFFGTPTEVRKEITSFLGPQPRGSYNKLQIVKRVVDNHRDERVSLMTAKRIVELVEGMIEYQD
jgi:hypothetical protein